MLTPAEILATYAEWLLAHDIDMLTVDIHNEDHVLGISVAEGDGNYLVLDLDGVTQHYDMGYLHNHRCLSCGEIVPENRDFEERRNSALLTRYIERLEREIDANDR